MEVASAAVCPFISKAAAMYRRDITERNKTVNNTVWVRFEGTITEKTLKEK